jgi:hypothetical protein
MKKTLVLSAAATAALALAFAAFYPGKDLCVMCVAIQDRLDDAGKSIQGQTDLELCGVAPDGGADLPGISKIIKCGDAYTEGANPIVEAPEAKDEPVKKNEKPPKAKKDKLTDTASVVALGGTGAACADQRDGALLCEQLMTASPGRAAYWRTAPQGLVMEQGFWRGDGCIASVPFETQERERVAGCTNPQGAGCQIRSACKK